MKKTVLIFPAGMPRSLDYLKKCQQEAQPVIGASSLGFDASREKYPAWVHLPYVTDVLFDEALKQAITALNISEIYTPNIVVWNYLNENMERLAPGVNLANTSPIDEVLGGYRTALSKAQYLLANPLDIASDVAARAPLSKIEVGALNRYADLIPGMCDDDKLRALLEIARYTVPGDIVEIGSWWGKSAFILAWLARCFNIGSLLCVDPWANEHLLQNEKIVDSGSAQVDADEALTVFKIGMLPFSAHHINYLRLTSVAAAAHYKASQTIDTEDFGRTQYLGKISILHIDGNHAYEAAKADIEAWSSSVVAGGWIIIDDYVWPYGDGPKRVGDEYLAANKHRFCSAFVMGTALFLQLSHN